MDPKAIARRIKSMREDLGISVGAMSAICGLSEREYLDFESGAKDFTFSFLNACSNEFGIDIAELLTGQSLSCLRSFAIERKGRGLPVDRRPDFKYLHMASRFLNHKIDPLYVEVPYSRRALEEPIATNAHEGQEFDYVLRGGLKYTVNGQIFHLGEGDSIMLDSANPHGMVASTEDGCTFIAIVVKK